MKILLLIRHAKSSWKNPILADIDRPLNKRGRLNAPFMGQRLKKHGIKPDLIISSPAMRALKTAKLIAKEINFAKKNIVTDDLIYGADVSTLVEVIKKIDDSFSIVMMFGHNPDFSELAEYLTNRQVHHLPTCGVLCMELAVNSWKEISNGEGTLKFFDYPKKSII